MSDQVEVSGVSDMCEYKPSLGHPCAGSFLTTPDDTSVGGVGDDGADFQQKSISSPVNNQYQGRGRIDLATGERHF